MTSLKRAGFTSMLMLMLMLMAPAPPSFLLRGPHRGSSVLLLASGLRLAPRDGPAEPPGGANVDVQVQDDDEADAAEAEDEKLEEDRLLALEDGKKDDDTAEAARALMERVYANLVGGPPAEEHKKARTATPSSHNNNASSADEGAPAAPVEALLLQELLRRTGGAEECDLCDASQPDWLFVFGTGRSGSTAVLEMVNALPMFNLAGENHGIMDSLKQISSVQDLYPGSWNANGTMDRPGDGDPHEHGDVSEQKVRCALQAYVKALIGDYDETTTQVIGFKEIHAPFNDEDFTFFHELFPCARYVLNSRRRLVEQARSQQADIDISGQHRHLKKILEEITEKTRFFESWQAEHPGEAFTLKLEDAVKGPTRFNAMLSWLGVEGCEFTQVAHANDSATKVFGYVAHSERPKLKGSCTFQRETRFFARGDNKMDDDVVITATSSS